jgi:hypothetical protein
MTVRFDSLSVPVPGERDFLARCILSPRKVDEYV